MCSSGLMSFPVYLAPVLRGLCTQWTDNTIKLISLYTHPPTHLQTVFLLVCHGPTVLTRSLPELGDLLTLIDPLLVPVVDGVEFPLLLVLWPLVREAGPTQTDVPRGLADVLGYVGVDVPGRE